MTSSNKGKPYQVLALDGGGIRGLYRNFKVITVCIAEIMRSSVAACNKHDK